VAYRPGGGEGGGTGHKGGEDDRLGLCINGRDDRKCNREKSRVREVKFKRAFTAVAPALIAC